MGDANTPSASSADAGAAGTAQDANSSANSSDAESKGAKEPVKSLHEHLFPKKDSSLKVKGAEESPASESHNKDDGDPTDLDADGAVGDDKTGEELDSGGEPKDGDESKPDDTPEDQLPFHKHPRWRQMKKENAELRGKQAQIEPKAKAYDDFVGKVSGAGLQGRDLDQLLDVGALLKSDPRKAHEYLKGYVSDLGIQLGLTLPPELQKRVDEGYLTMEDAQRLARAEADSKLTKAANDSEAEQNRISAQQKLKSDMKTALSQKEFAWKAKDPDYEKLQPEVEDRFLRLSRERPPKSTADIERLFDEAVDHVKKRRASGLPPAQPRKPPITSGASVETKTEPKNMRDAIKGGLKSGSRK